MAADTREEQVLGKEHPETLGSVNNLASLLYARADYAGAELLYRRALETQERTLGVAFLAFPWNSFHWLTG